MREVRVREFGGPEVLEVAEAPDPSPAPGEVLVDVAAADVMYLDTLVRRGWGGDFFPVRPPYVPGNGMGGRVAAVGAGVDAAWVGAGVVAETGPADPETGVSTAPTGGSAERVAVAAHRLVPVPAGVEVRDAVAVLHDGPTALRLAEAGAVRPGAWVLVAAAAGGGGSLLVQLVRAAGGRVIGAARGERKLELVRGLGAEAVVDYSAPDWADRVRALTGGRGADVVYDGASGAIGRTAFELTAPGGRFVTYGTTDGEFAPVDPEDAARRGVELTTLFGLLDMTGPRKRDSVAQVLELVAKGELRPVIGQTFRFAEAAAAHAAFESRSTVAKTLLVP
ncbi:NADPH2:quinone reductase [Streptomonospora nanhaiensis]|uniref:NADPH2:quinone reductase n=1 Tax=Streptomonospora nanhaiensis TaxID=1323731 RepID=A0A853BST1_9ACTN|nr:zinc-binding dehydrogenase [Streptomonospora nanhaiensis]NYI98203.1 NADPH2:quinone reductase [Streptomonospora nanhaiensis]